MLQIFSAAYNSKALTVPLTWLQVVLDYSDELELEKDLGYCNLSIITIGDTGTKMVKFEKMKFDAAVGTSVRKYSIIIRFLFD